MQVRPDDIDMNQHVHGSRYSIMCSGSLRPDERCYKMPMQEFLKAGYGWYIKTAHVEYKRALGLGERFRVATWIDAIRRNEVEVKFEISRSSNGKLCSDGHFVYTLISLKPDERK